jgi:hypothetical protein
LKSVLIDFYFGNGRNTNELLIFDIWKYDFEEIEWRHDFIQWLFPLPEPSEYNSDAPVLTIEEAKTFSKTPILQREVLYSLDFMLKFYGLERRRSELVTVKLEQQGTRNESLKKYRIVKAKNFEERLDEWHIEDSHHHMRLSRMVRSLNYLGLSEWASLLREALIDIAENSGAEQITNDTKNLWEGLLQDPEPSPRSSHT